MTTLAGSAVAATTGVPSSAPRPWRVLALDAVVLAAAVPGLVWLAGDHRPFRLGIALLVTGLFAIAEAFPIQVERGGRSSSFVFTTVPLVVGLTLLPVALVVALRSAVALVVALVIPRWGLTRAGTTFVIRMAQTTAAGAVIVVMRTDVPNRPLDWLVIGLAVVTSKAVGSVLGLAARSLSVGRFAPEALRDSSTGWLALGPDLLLGLVAAIALDADTSSAWLVAGIGVVFVLLVRLYVQVSTRYRAELHENEQLATLDRLTGLPNRILFTRWLADSLDRAEPVTVLVLGLDRFKDVNETLGHAAGDLLLRAVSERLRDEDLRLARLGGDEFAMLWHSSDPRDCTQRAQVVLDRLSGLYRLDDPDLDLELDVSATAGLALGSSSGAPLPGVTLLRRADVAMNVAKRDRIPLAVYSPQLDTFSTEQLALVGALRSAIEGDELALHFQPMVDLETGRIVAAEALVRWHPPGRDAVPTPQFIEIAERTGLIRPLTRLVLDQATAQARQWLDAGHDWRVSVNLSSRNVVEPGLVDHVSAVLVDVGLPPERLEIELTETSVMADPVLAADVMRRLRSLGVTIAVDDFGTGHSSLAQATRLPVDQLKIDQSFIRDMEEDPAALAVVETIIDLGRRLGLGVVAEGVETELAVSVLRDLGCKIAQGFYVAAPMPAAAFDAWAASGTSVALMSRVAGADAPD